MTTPAIKSATTPTATSGDSDDGQRVLRRIERLALGYGVLGAAACGFGQDWRGAAVLTLAAVASIVNFRGLEAFSLLFEPHRQGHLGPRNTLLIALRLVFLAGVLSAALVLGSRHFLALLLGLSVIPAALMTEGVIEACGLERNGKYGG